MVKNVESYKVIPNHILTIFVDDEANSVAYFEDFDKKI